MLENDINPYRNYKVIMIDGDKETVLASHRTKYEAMTMVSYMEEYDDLLGLASTTYKVILENSDVNTLNN